MVFLLSLFGTNMTAFTILGSAGHAFANGIVTFALMASASAFVIPLTLFFAGTRMWALGKRHGFMTPVQMFRDRWECGHIGTAIFVVQAALLVPYIIIGVMGGGTALRGISGGVIPYWLGGAVVAIVVMSYVFFGGMRGTAFVNAFQTVMFLSFGAIALIVIGRGMGGFPAAMESLLASPTTAPLLTRERISPWYFFSYTFIPLSTIAFPHIAIFCFTARRMVQFKRTVILYPICILAIWLPCVFLGVAANSLRDVPRIEQKLEARAALAALPPNAPAEERAALRRQAAGDDVVLVMLERFAPLWLAGLLGAGIMAAVMASDSQILALSTMFTEDVFAFYGGTARVRRERPGADRPSLRRRADVDRVLHRPACAAGDLRPRGAVRVLRLLRALAAALCGALLEAQHQVGRARRHAVGRLRRHLHLARPRRARLVRPAPRCSDDADLLRADARRLAGHSAADAQHLGSLLPRVSVSPGDSHSQDLSHGGTEERRRHGGNQLVRGFQSACRWPRFARSAGTKTTDTSRGDREATCVCRFVSRRRRPAGVATSSQVFGTRCSVIAAR